MIRLTVLLFFLTTGLYAQDGQYNLGAANNSMAGASVATTNSWATFNNPGALGKVTKTSAFVSYQNRFRLNELSVIGGGFNYCTPLINTAIKYFKFGDDLFNQQMAGLVIANKIQMVSLGMGVNVIQTHVEGIETSGTFVIEFGGQVELSKHIAFGAHIFNLNAKDLPSIIKAGFSIAPTETLKLNTEVQKAIDYREKYCLGIQYTLIPQLFFRSGINFQPTLINKVYVNHALGLGVMLKRIMLDYAFTSQNELGANHEMSLTYNFHKL